MRRTRLRPEPDTNSAKSPTSVAVRNLGKERARMFAFGQIHRHRSRAHAHSRGTPPPKAAGPVGATARMRRCCRSNLRKRSAATSPNAPSANKNAARRTAARSRCQHQRPQKPQPWTAPRFKTSRRQNHEHARSRRRRRRHREGASGDMLVDPAPRPPVHRLDPQRRTAPHRLHRRVSARREPVQRLVRRNADRGRPRHRHRLQLRPRRHGDQPLPPRAPTAACASKTRIT